MENGRKQRDGRIDAIKAFAIICVVFAHCIEFGSGQIVLSEELFFDDPLVRFICSFHMPLFMLVSGYLFGFSIKKGTFSSVVGRKCKTLLIPLLAWASIEVCLSVAPQIMHTAACPSFKDLISGLVHHFLYHQWFLWAVFWCSLIVAAIHFLLKDSLIVYLTVFLLLFFLPDGHDIALYKYMYPYFVIGYLFNGDWHRKTDWQNHKAIYTVVSWGLFLSLLLLYNRDSFIYTSGYTIIRGKTFCIEQLWIDLYRFIIGLAGSTAIILTIESTYPLFPPVLKKAASHIGMNTLGIYLLSNVIFNDHLLKTVSFRLDGVCYGIVILETLVVILVTLLLTWLIRKSSLLNTVLLGGRS